MGAAALSLTLTACGGGGGAEAGGGGSAGGTIDTSHASGDVSYWLWDANQLPAYQACADKFKQANPNINVKITQYGWDDYWGKLTNGFVAGDAPDVFTDHFAKYPEFVSQEQLVPLDETLTKDGFDAQPVPGKGSSERDQLLLGDELRVLGQMVSKNIGHVTRRRNRWSASPVIVLGILGDLDIDIGVGRLEVVRAGLVPRLLVGPTASS